MTLAFTSLKIWPDVYADVYAMDCETVLIENCAIGRVTYQLGPKTLITVFTGVKAP